MAAFFLALFFPGVGASSVQKKMAAAFRGRLVGAALLLAACHAAGVANRASGTFSIRYKGHSDEKRGAYSWTGQFVVGSLVIWLLLLLFSACFARFVRLRMRFSLILV